MKHLHTMVTTVLAIGVVVLAILLYRQNNLDPKSSPTSKNEELDKKLKNPEPQVERITEAEEVLEKMGYAAWVYRWKGGMLNAQVHSQWDVGPFFDGKVVWSDLKSMMKGANQTPTNSEWQSSQGMFAAVVGPIPNKKTMSSPLPCFFYFKVKTGKREMSRWGRQNVAWWGTQKDRWYQRSRQHQMNVRIIGKAITNKDGTKLPDHDGEYSLIKLQWLKLADLSE